MSQPSAREQSEQNPPIGSPLREAMAQAFAESKGIAQAAELVAWAAIASGDEGQARALFEQASQMASPEPLDERRARWGEWSLKTDSPAAVHALSAMGLDWEASFASTGEDLADLALSSGSDEALAAMQDAGFLTPRRVRRESRWLGQWRPEMSMLAWVAGSGREKAFSRLMRDPGHKTQESLDEALWACAQNFDPARDGSVALQLLQNGANPFLPWRAGNRTPRGAEHANAGASSSSWLTDAMSDSDWLEGPERERAIQRSEQKMPLAIIARKVQRRKNKALDTRKLPKRDGRFITPNELFEELLAEDGLDKFWADCNDPRGWGPRVAEANWDSARDLIAHSLLQDETEPRRDFWDKAGQSIDWGQAPEGPEGAGILAFLMRQSSFGQAIKNLRGQTSTPKEWTGKACFESLLRGGAKVHGDEPESDPMELALFLAAGRGLGNPLEAWADLAKAAGRPERFKPQSLGRAARFLAKSAAKWLVQQGPCALLNEEAFSALKKASFLAPAPELGDAWLALLEEGAKALRPFEEARMRAEHKGQAQAIGEKLQLRALAVEMACEAAQRNQAEMGNAPPLCQTKEKSEAAAETLKPRRI